MKKIYVAGHNGLVGSAICRRLEGERCEILKMERQDLDLTDQRAVNEWFLDNPVNEVYLAAAKVGGISANDQAPAEFIRDNLAIQTNVIHAAWNSGVDKLLFLGSSCIYPKFAEQPIVEDSLLTGLLEPTNECYAIAKIAGIKMCQAYRRQYGFDAISVMPTNMYGPGDNFDLETSHVLPALIAKFHRAKITESPSATIWGSGRPRREFLYVDDLADACFSLMAFYSGEEIINVGWGRDISIAELASLIAEIVGFEGEIELDSSRPDGTPRKLLDTSRLSALGWAPKVSLREGVTRTYEAFLQAKKNKSDAA